MAFLRANDGPQAGHRFDLTEHESTLGRHPDCHIVIEIGAVSRRHAKVLREAEDRFLVEDLGSRNGTYLNDQQIAGREILNHGDQVRVCDVSFTFHRDESPIRPTITEGSSLSAVMIDDEAANATIVSKVEVSSHYGQLQFSASPEAKLSALIEITQSLGKAIKLDDVLPKVLESLFKIFIQADRGFIGLLDDKGTLIPRWTKARRDEAEETIRVSRTIVNHVLDSKEAILSADAASDSRFEMSQSVADFRIRSMMCAPLIDSDDKAFGVLQIDTLDQRNKFTGEDLELLVSTATQAAVAIDNARLLEGALHQQALQRDLELAYEVQKGFLPDHRPQLPGYEFFDYYAPANHVGGDYFDYITLPDGRTAILVADVVGHGVAAALMMAKLSAEARYCLAASGRPDEAVTKLNDRLTTLQVDRFVTMIMVVLNPINHEVTIVNAGHMPPIYRRGAGQVEEPGGDVAGLPLGIMDGMDYEQEIIHLAPGESLTLYTDGLNEAMNANSELYGMDRIRNFVSRDEEQIERVGEQLIADVRQFLAGEPQEDDMCLVCVRRKPDDEEENAEDGITRTERIQATTFQE